MRKLGYLRKKTTIQFKSDAKPSNAHSTGCFARMQSEEIRQATRPGSRHGIYSSWLHTGSISACHSLYKMQCPFKCATAGLPPRLNLHNSYGGNLAKVCINDQKARSKNEKIGLNKKLNADYVKSSPFTSSPVQYGHQETCILCTSFHQAPGPSLHG